MSTLKTLLENHPQISGYKLNDRKKESVELFFVKGKLETVRFTDTCDQEVTVYVDHDGCKGDAQFFVYASTTEEQLKTMVDEAAARALLISNQAYSLPAAETGDFAVESNFQDQDPMDLASRVAEDVFAANHVIQAALNSVEIFINKYHSTVTNSLGLHKTQISYDAMVEAIPTFNGENQSVELYEQYNFSSLDDAVLRLEIGEKLDEVRSRYYAVHPDFAMEGPVVLNKLELHDLFSSIAGDLNYATVYAHSNLFKKGELIQNDRTGDPIGITMRGAAPGCVSSSSFDADGVSLGQARIVDGGKVESYYGANRFGQYLGEEHPTGALGCLCVDPGTLKEEETRTGLEVISMSGLQVDFYNDYIGGEVRLAYYYKDGQRLPVTGVSITGSLREVLNHIRLSDHRVVHDNYVGPEKALIDCMKIF